LSSIFKVYSNNKIILFYSITLSSIAMGLQIQGDLRRLKRKLSVFLDLLDSSLLSQNPSVSTPAEKKKKLSSFSQSQPTRRMQNFSIYSESSLSDDSESALEISKSQVFIEILKKTSFDLSQYSPLSDSIYSRTPLRPKDTIYSYLRLLPIIYESLIKKSRGHI